MTQLPITSVSASPPRALTARAPRVTALAIFVLLACIHTWPLATNPAHLSRIDNGDAMLNIWAVAWVAHQLPRDPLHLFNANIFYPERLTLAYSEAMLVQGLLATPIIAAGGSPVLAFNLVLLAGFALTGWAFCLLVHRWTGSWGAGYTCGSLAAFNSHVLVRLAHLQTQHVEFIALILFALDRLIVTRQVRHALWLGIGFALQGLTSIYLLVFSTWMLLFAVLMRARDWLRRDAVRMIGRLGLAGVVAAILMGPYLSGYYWLRRGSGFERAVIESRMYAASWIDYLSTGSRLHYSLWSWRFIDASASATFPGIVAIALVGLAFVWPETRRDSRVRMCAGAGIGCAVVSMLPSTEIFPRLYAVIPLFRMVRVVAHMGQIVLLMIAVVAGFGVAGLRRRVTDPRRWAAVALVLCALVNLETLRAPLGYRTFTEVPPIYDVLRQASDAVVVELPFAPPEAFFASATYMLNSTRHWRPILNGYSGFRPRSYGETYTAVRGFPDVGALTALHERGVTHIVVHEHDFRATAGSDRFEAIARSPSLLLLADSGDIQVYRLR